MQVIELPSLQRPNRPLNFLFFQKNEKSRGCAGVSLLLESTLQRALASEEKEESSSPAWALHLLFLVVTEAADLFSGPLFPSGSDVSEASRSSKI